jgi:methyl-accepting chemotaxis protein
MQEFSEDMDQEVSISLEKLEIFNRSLSELIASAHSIKIENKVISDSLFLDLAKLDHIVFKLSAYDSVFKENSSTPFSSHTECRFGKWYLESGKEVLASSLLNDINTSHKVLHDSIKAIPKLIENGKIANAEVIIKLFEETEKSSVKLFSLLSNTKNKNT